MADDQAPAPLLIHGIRVSGFRTLRDVEVVSTGQVTVICGPNNTGKSSLLDVVAMYPEFYGAVTGLRQIKKQPPPENATVGIALDPTIPGFKTLLAPSGSDKHLEKQADEIIESLSQHLNGPLWLVVRQAGESLVADTSLTLEPLEGLIQRWVSSGRRTLARRLSEAGGGREPKLSPAWPGAVAKKLLRRPTIRRISDVRRAADQPLRGDQLRTLVEAAPRKTTGRRVKPWTETLERILKDCFGPDVTYEVRTEGDDIGFWLAIDGEHEVPLRQVGAGVREVVAIAYEALAEHADVLCIEEPENCLHPAAARRLVQSLTQRTNVQLFITTHSPAVVNTRPDTLVHISRTDGLTKSRAVTNAAWHYDVIWELGASPADLVLTRCAVWVEGPSDRLYLTAWLGQEGLTEGMDYQVMFYGGVLGTHLTVAMDPDAENTLTAIRTLSRRCVEE